MLRHSSNYAATLVWDLLPNYFLDMWQLWLSRTLNKHGRSSLPPEYGGVSYLYVQAIHSGAGAAEDHLRPGGRGA